MSSYSGRIMNIPADPNIDYQEDAQCCDELLMDLERQYKIGHRDARHAAADITMEAEREIDRLKAAIREIQMIAHFGPIDKAIAEVCDEALKDFGENDE